MVLFFIELSTRRVEIAGIASVANGLWMTQMARNVTDPFDGILAGKQYLIHDRDPLYTAEFLTILQGVGVKSVRLPPRSPNLNAHAERFVRSIKESCLDRMILFGEASLKTTIRNFVAHHHSERNHQGLANRIILPEASHLGASGSCTEAAATGRHVELTIGRRHKHVRRPLSVSLASVIQTGQQTLSSKLERILTAPNILRGQRACPLDSYCFSIQQAHRHSRICGSSNRSDLSRLQHIRISAQYDHDRGISTSFGTGSGLSANASWRI
jgi:Integrase core domain